MDAFFYLQNEMPSLVDGVLYLQTTLGLLARHL